MDTLFEQWAEMRDEERRNGRIGMVFENGADSFFHKGTNGRWRSVLTPEQLDRYDALVADGLSDDAANWLESGSLALGTRPRAI